MPRPAATKAKKTLFPRWTIAIPIVLLLGVIALVLFLSRDSLFLTRTPTPTPPITDISVDEAFVLFGEQAVTFLDLRPAVEWKAYRIDKSVNIPYADFAGRINELTRTDTIVVIDAIGGEPAIKTQESLKRAGFTAIWVRGGMEAWVQRRYPLIGTAPY
jgi:rhodanese-related sulfurtransferase